MTITEMLQVERRKAARRAMDREAEGHHPGTGLEVVDSDCRDDLVPDPDRARVLEQQYEAFLTDPRRI